MSGQTCRDSTLAREWHPNQPDPRTPETPSNMQSCCTQIPLHRRKIISRMVATGPPIPTAPPTVGDGVSHRIDRLPDGPPRVATPSLGEAATVAASPPTPFLKRASHEGCSETLGRRRRRRRGRRGCGRDHQRITRVVACDGGDRTSCGYNTPHHDSCIRQRSPDVARPVLPLRGERGPDNAHKNAYPFWRIAQTTQPNAPSG